MKQPEISVILPVFNGERYLHEAINSIREQTFSDFELIIIDDSSTDRSLAILQDYAEKDSRIRILKKEENVGIEGFIENLNWGLQQAKGKYVARMDQDDISDLLRFEKQYRFLENNPDILVVGSSVTTIDEDGKDSGEMIAPTGDDSIKKQMQKSIALFHPSIMFRNKRDIKYREKMLYCEDYDLYLRLISAGMKLANLPEKLLKYRIHSNSISRKDSRFIKYLFIFKMFSFHRERIKYSKDSYDNFAPEDFLHIHDPQHQHKKETLFFALKVALAMRNKEVFSKLIESLKQNYGDSALPYTLISKLPDFIFRILGATVNRTR